ncbi:MAG: hypothetical protein KC501_18065 [Myxococcales bacterium]|nr:hypothetical protein [Myxococcales bacterium]
MPISTGTAALVTWLATQPSGTSAEGEPVESVDPDDGSRALSALELAQTKAEAGDVDGALRYLEDAITWDPSLAAAYLTRAQILFGRLGDPIEAPSEDAARSRWLAQAEQALADLDRYIELTASGPEDGHWLQAKRDELRAAIARAEASREPPDPDEPDPEPDPVETEPARPRRGPPLALLATGSLLSAGAVGTMAAGLRIEPQCRLDECSVRRWVPSTPWLATGTALSVLGTGLVTSGAILLARRGSAEPIPRRRRRRVAFAMLVSSGVALVTSAALGGAAASRAAREPDDLDGLSRTQSLANASLAAGSLVPALLGGGLGLWLTRPAGTPPSRPDAAAAPRAAWLR